MPKVDFKFNLDESVKIQGFEIGGVIIMLSLDESGRTYYVKTAEGGNWWKENELVRRES